MTKTDRGQSGSTACILPRLSKFLQQICNANSSVGCRNSRRTTAAGLFFFFLISPKDFWRTYVTQAFVYFSRAENSRSWRVITKHCVERHTYANTAEADYQRPLGLLTDFPETFSMLCLGWHSFVQVSSTQVYTGPLPKTYHCVKSHKEFKGADVAHNLYPQGPLPRAKFTVGFFLPDLVPFLPDLVPFLPDLVPFLPDLVPLGCA